MKAVVLEENERLVYRDVETPDPAPGAVRVKVAVCGICGSDVPRVFDHAAHNYPLVLGHEFSGTVDAVGEGVRGFAAGERVAAAPLVPCHDCEDCRRGDYALCSRYSFVGSRQNGAMADYVTVPAANLVKLGASLSFAQAATVEPATVALHAFRLVDFAAGSSVAVLGCGIIGLYAVAWAKLLGASSVTAVSRGRAGLEAAARMGADETVSTAGGADWEAALRGRGFSYVMECSGADLTMHLALQLVGKKGTVCFVGTPKKDVTFTVPQWEQINRKECRVTGSWMSYSAPFPGSEWHDTVRAMQDGRLRCDEGLVDSVYPMAQAAEAFRAIRSGQTKGRVLLSNLPEEEIGR